MSWDYTKHQIRDKDEGSPVKKRLTYKEMCEIGRKWMEIEPWDLSLVRYKNRGMVNIGYFVARRGETGRWSVYHDDKKITARSIAHMYYLLVLRLDKRRIKESHGITVKSFRLPTERKSRLDDEELASLAAISLGMGEQKFLPSNRYGSRQQ